MENKELKAPKPIQVHPFIHRRGSKQSIQNNRQVYRKTERVKSDHVINNPSQFDLNLCELEEVEMDFIEIDAMSEILSILKNEASFISSFNLRDSEVSVFSDDFNDTVEENSFHIKINNF